MSIPFVNVADLRDDSDPQGRSYRQVNATKGHNIPLGALVEVGFPTSSDENDGVRLFVAHHSRDCDETPLYWLSADKCQRMGAEDRSFPHGMVGGYPEECLTVIRQP
jgi:hypothetical protein